MNRNNVLKLNDINVMINVEIMMNIGDIVNRVNPKVLFNFPLQTLLSLCIKSCDGMVSHVVVLCIYVVNDWYVRTQVINKSGELNGND
jgi:hypothetical protein